MALEGIDDVGDPEAVGPVGLTLIKIRLFRDGAGDMSGWGHGEAFGLISRTVFPKVSLTCLQRAGTGGGGREGGGRGGVKPSSGDGD
ncbi:unnamed protein product, partial [Discosporangium mesarthrocarpum]